MRCSKLTVMCQVTAAAALLAIPTIASAHGGNNDANVVHACIGNVSKIVRVVGVTGVCIAAPPLIAETPAHWDVQGPPGKDGTNGTNGINGTNGTNGTNGIDGTSVTFVGYFPQTISLGNCLNTGGVIYAVGNPPVNTYVCNGPLGPRGQDGEDGTNATRADGPCFDNGNRYVDCGNGTVTDTVTGLIWLKQWDCLPTNTWVAANHAVAGLKDGDCSLTDKSSPGDWRLPTIAEWEATIARAIALGCTFPGSGGPPSLTNDSGTACYGAGAGSSFAAVAASDGYWSSTTNEVVPGNAWYAYFRYGELLLGDKTGSIRVWPVRGGSR
jgi:hypothetical protein